VLRERACAAAWAALLLAAGAHAAAACGDGAATPAEATACRLRDAALDDPTAFAILTELTTRFGPRLAGTRAEREAAVWAAERMRALGLAEVRVEPFPLTGWERGAGQVEIVGDAAQPLAATALGGTGPTPPDGVEGEVAIFPTLEALRAAAPGSLAGKIAMLDYQMPRLESGLGYNVATRGRGEGPIEAAKRGAVGFVMRSAGTGGHRFPHTGSTRFEAGRVPIPAFALAAPDAEQVARLAARGPVRLRLTSSARVEPGRTSQNVIGDLPGRSDETILIGAHLDSWDLGTGAVDDGAGVAVVLAAAKLLAATAPPPRRTIRVILFGAEEVNQPAAPFFIVGGHAYADVHRGELERYAIAGESDLGAGRVTALALPPGWAASDLAAAAARVLLPLGVVLEGSPAPHGGADMLPLQRQGVPVFLFFQDAARYFDLHHTADDTLDKVDPAELRQVVAAWAAFLWLLAESDADFRSPPPSR
jgi:carboxypeptidase Q